MWPLGVWIVAALATARAIRLVTEDDFPFGRLRAWAEENTGWLGEMLGCPWCASGYLSAVTTATLWVLYGAAMPIACWFALWHLSIAAFLALELLAKFLYRD